EIVRHEAPEPVVGCGLLVQRHTDTPDHRAENLAARDLRIEDATGRDRTDHARDADDAKLFVNPDIGEYGRVREMREFTVLIRFDARLFLDPVDPSRLRPRSPGPPRLYVGSCHPRRSHRQVWPWQAESPVSVVREREVLAAPTGMPREWRSRWRRS